MTAASTLTVSVSLSVADSGLVGWPNMLRDFGGGAGENRQTSTATPPGVQHLATLLPNKQEIANATGQSAAEDQAAPGSDSGKRLKRLNRAAQMNAIAMVQGPDGTPKFRCKQCNRVFNLRCTVLRHVRHQHEGRFVPHPCSQCGQVFKRTDHLKVHMRKIHNVTSSKRLKKESGELDVDGMDEEEELENGGPSPTDMLSVSMVPIPTSLPPNSTPTTLAVIAGATSMAAAPTPPPPVAIPVTTSADAAAAAAYSAAAHTLAQLAAQRSEQTNAVALALIANKQPENTPGLAHQ